MRPATVNDPLESTLSLAEQQARLERALAMTTDRVGQRGWDLPALREARQVAERALAAARELRERLVLEAAATAREDPLRWA